MGATERLARAGEFLCLLLVLAAIGTMQVLVGGTRLVYCLPSSAAIGLAGGLAIFFLRRPKPTPNQICLAVAALFFAYILARAWLSPVPYIARSDIYSVLAGLVVYYLFACVFTDARLRLFVVGALLVLALAHVFVGALQFRDGNNFMPISWLQRYDYGPRASGFYVCPNHLAGLLEVVGILGLSAVCWSRWPIWLKLLVGYAVGVCYVGVILTGSRGGYLSTAASVIVFAFLSLAILRRSSRRAFWTVGGAGAVAAIILAAVAMYAINRSPYLSGRANNVIDTSNIRLDLWQAAIQQWHLQPVFGTGSGTHLYFGRLFRAPGVQRDPIYVHNDYLHLLAEYGLVGAAGMFLFVGAHLLAASRNFARLGPKRVAVSQRVLSNALALNVGSIAAVSSYLVHSVFDFNLHIPANLLLMAFVFGMLANEGVTRDPAMLAPPSRAFLWRAAPALLGLFLLLQSVRLFPSEYFSEHARAATRDNQPAVAIREAVRGLEHDHANPDLYYYLGSARTQLGLAMEDAPATRSFYGDAIPALEKAHALAPRDEFYALELATALDATGRFEEAEWRFGQALQLDPKSNSLQKYYEGHLKLWRESGSAEGEKPTPENEP